MPVELIEGKWFARKYFGVGLRARNFSRVQPLNTGLQFRGILGGCRRGCTERHRPEPPVHAVTYRLTRFGGISRLSRSCSVDCRKPKDVKQVTR